MEEENKIIYSWPLPHLRQDAPFVQYPLIDENQKIKMWHKDNENYILLKIVGIHNSYYFSKNIQSTDDSYIKFIDFVYQKIQIFDNKTILKIQTDIQNLLISLSKIEYFFKCEEISNNSMYYVQTEVEYILITCRSLFDLLQEIIRKFLSKIQFINYGNNTNLKVKELSSSFGDMCLLKDEIISADKLYEKYKLPTYIINFYLENAKFFKSLRKMRDDIVHRGFDTPLIFKLEKGFAIDSKNKSSFTEIINDFKIWDENSFAPNNLAPLLPAIAYVIYNSINATSKFINILENPKYFKGLPYDIAPGYKLYLRSSFAKYFNNLETIIKNNTWSF